MALVPRPRPEDCVVEHHLLTLLFCLIGVYTVSNAIFNIYVMIAFGVLGYLMKRSAYAPAPLVLAFVLGLLLENNLRTSLILSQDDFALFFTRPISAVCLTVAVVLLVSPLVPRLGKKRQAVAVEEVSSPARVPVVPRRESAYGAPGGSEPTLAGRHRAGPTKGGGPACSPSMPRSGGFRTPP